MRFVRQLLRRMRRGREEDGYIIMEATICLPVFMFAMLMVLHVAKMAYVQERIGVALNSTAKQMAEYSHVYFAVGMGDMFSGSGGSSSAIADKIGGALKTIGETFGSDTITAAGSALEGDSIAAYAQDLIGESIAEDMMKKNVLAGSSESWDAFERRYKVSNLSLGRSKIFQGSADLFLRVDYDIKVIQFLKVDVVHHCAHVSRTQAWRGGNPVKKPEGGG